VIQQITLEEGRAINMLTLRHKEVKWTRIVNVSYKGNEIPIEKYFTFKFTWNLFGKVGELDKA
jgi:hypothetical protein